MRVTANHLVVNLPNHIDDIEAALFARDIGMKKNLKQQIAHFLRELGIVAAIERFEHFIGFLNQISAKSGVGLLPVPRTAVGRAQTFLHRHQFLKPFTGVRGRGFRPRSGGFRACGGR